jgi:hypothetical protein
VRPFIHDAVPQRTPWLQRSIRNFPRFVDQIFRRIPMMPLVSLEPGELRALIARPFRLVAVDISQRVLKGIQRDYPGVECHRIDIAAGRIPVLADVVIAYSVLTRTSDGRIAMKNVLESVKPDGLILLDDRSARRWLPPPPDFTVVSEQIYRRSDLSKPRP